MVLDVSRGIADQGRGGRDRRILQPRQQRGKRIERQTDVGIEHAEESLCAMREGGVVVGAESPRRRIAPYVNRKRKRGRVERQLFGNIHCQDHPERNRVAALEVLQQIPDQPTLGMADHRQQEARGLDSYSRL